MLSAAIFATPGIKHVIVILHKVTNGFHWVIGHMNGLPAEDVHELNATQQKTSNRALVLVAHSLLLGFLWCLSPTVNNIHAYAALKRQPFQRAKRHLAPATSAAIINSTTELTHTKAGISRCLRIRRSYCRIAMPLLKPNLGLLQGSNPSVKSVSSGARATCLVQATS